MKITESKGAAVGALVLVVLIIVLTFGLRPVWWAFIDVFFLFMMAFTFFVSVMFGKYNLNAKKKLQKISVICGIFWIVSLIGEFVAFQALCDVL